jgi:hypothetical protein
MEQFWLSATGGHGTVMEVVLWARESQWTRSIRSDVEVADVNLLRNWGGAFGSKMVAMFCAYISSVVNSKAKQRSKCRLAEWTHSCAHKQCSLCTAVYAFCAKLDCVGELYYFFLTMVQQASWAKASLFSRIYDHRHTTLGRPPLDEWSARRRHIYVTTHNTHKRHTSMPPSGFEPTIPASERIV